MTKANLKAALDALQVKNPLRLQAKAPAFTAPSVNRAAETPVENTTLVARRTHVQDTPQVGMETELQTTTEVANATQVAHSTQVEVSTQEAVPTSVGNSPPVGSMAPAPDRPSVGKSTQVDIPTAVESQPQVGKQAGAPQESPENGNSSAVLMRRATEQDSSVVLAARAADGLSRGYTRLPNEILMKLASGDFTRSEIKLVLLIARFTISFQRRLAPLSKTVIERQTGLRGPAVLEALSGLVTKGVIEKQQGDQHRPNQLGLILPKDWDQIGQRQEGTQAANPTSVGDPTRDAKPDTTGVEKTTSAGVGNPTPFKDIKKYKISLSQLPPPLLKYFSDLKPAQKRESEWKAFEGLRADYSPDEISDCLELLLEQGIQSGESSQRCHSPLAYLAKAMDSVLAEALARREAVNIRLERERWEAEIAREQQGREAKEAAEWSAKEKAFLEAFTSQEAQRIEIAKFLTGSPFSADSRPGRILGIGRWWELNEGG